MTLRSRLALLTSLAVALAIVVASVAAWALIRSSLLAEVDQRLKDRLPSAELIARTTAQRRTPVGPGGERGERGVAVVLQSNPIGVQIVSEDGTVTEQLAPGDIDLPFAEGEQALLDGTADGVLLRTVTVDGASYRVMSVVLDTGAFLRLVHPLAAVEQTMGRIAWLLVTVAGVGVVLAGGFGWSIARAGLRPVDRLVVAAERVADTRDLAHRIDLEGSSRGEVARLAAAMNAMLIALDGARAQQRELVENAGHELRTPLATLRNDLGLLLRAELHRDRALSPEDRAALLRDLEDEVVALSDLVGEVMDLARGDLEPGAPVAVDLQSLAERAVARTRRVNPTVEVIVRGSTIEVTVRPVAFERAIANLVRNAVQVSPDGERVEVLLGYDDGGVSVQVLDRGPGIPDEERARIFDRFYRGHGARMRHGSGLGLAIVAQVARLHEGRVSASDRPDGGAVLSMWIPTPAAGSGDCS